MIIFQWLRNWFSTYHYVVVHVKTDIGNGFGGISIQVKGLRKLNLQAVYQTLMKIHEQEGNPSIVIISWKEITFDEYLQMRQYGKLNLEIRATSV